MKRGQIGVKSHPSHQVEANSLSLARFEKYRDQIPSQGQKIKLAMQPQAQTQYKKFASGEISVSGMYCIASPDVPQVTLRLA